MQAVKRLLQRLGRKSDPNDGLSEAAIEFRGLFEVEDLHNVPFEDEDLNVHWGSFVEVAHPALVSQVLVPNMSVFPSSAHSLNPLGRRSHSFAPQSRTSLTPTSVHPRPMTPSPNRRARRRRRGLFGRRARRRREREEEEGEGETVPSDLSEAERTSIRMFLVRFVESQASHFYPDETCVDLSLRVREGNPSLFASSTSGGRSSQSSSSSSDPMRNRTGTGIRGGGTRGIGSRRNVAARSIFQPDSSPPVSPVADESHDHDSGRSGSSAGIGEENRVDGESVGVSSSAGGRSGRRDIPLGHPTDFVLGMAHIVGLEIERVLADLDVGLGGGQVQILRGRKIDREAGPSSGLRRDVGSGSPLSEVDRVRNGSFGPTGRTSPGSSSPGSPGSSLSTPTVPFESPLTIASVFDAFEIVCRSYHNRLLILRHSDLIGRLVHLLSELLNFFLEVATRKASLHPDRIHFVEEVLRALFRIMCHFVHAPDSLQLEAFQATAITEVRRGTLGRVPPAPKKVSRLGLEEEEEGGEEIGGVVFVGDADGRFVSAQKQKTMIDFLEDVSRIAQSVVEWLQKLGVILANRPDFTFVFSFQEAVLYIARELVRNTPEDFIVKCGGLQELVSYLCWPLELIEILFRANSWQEVNTATILRRTRVGSGCNRVHLYYDLQMLALRIVVEVAKLGPTYILSVEKLQGFQRISEMGMWVSFFLANEHHLHQSLYSLEENEIDLPRKVGPLRKPVCPGFIKKRPNERVWAFLEVVTDLTQFCFDSVPEDMFQKDMHELIDFMPLRKNPEVSPYLDLARVFLSFFPLEDPSDADGTHLQHAVAKLKCMNDFQLFFMDSLLLLTTKKPLYLDVLVSFGLLEVLFSDYFYFFGGMSNELNRYRAVHLERVRNTKKGEVAAATSNVLRQSVTAFITYHAILEDHSNYLEVRKLVDLMHLNSDNPILMIEIARVFWQILSQNFEVSEKSLVKMKGFLPIISHLVHIQEDMAARSEMIRVLYQMIQSPLLQVYALVDRKAMDVLFDLCFQHVEIARKTALEHVTRLLCNEVPRSSFSLICSCFAQCFPRFQALAAQEDDRSLTDVDTAFLISMLEAMQQSLVTSKRAILQEEFGNHVDKLMLVCHIPNKDSHRLCLAFLKTIRLMLTRNSMMKQQWRLLTDQFQTLEPIILDWENQSPTRECYSELFDILVDGEYQNGAGETVINNADVLVLILGLLKHTEKRFQKTILGNLFRMIDGRISNQQSCASIGLVSICLEMLDSYHNRFEMEREVVGFDELPDVETLKGLQVDVLQAIVGLLTSLARHSMSVKELRAFLLMMKKKASLSRMRVFHRMIESCREVLKSRPSPEAFFDFDGVSSGMQVEMRRPWPPGGNAFTLCFWMRVDESVGDMRVFSFVDVAAGNGLFVSLQREFVAVDVMKRRKTPLRHHFTCHFNPGEWVHIALVQSRKLMGTTIALYLNGRKKGQQSLARLPQLQAGSLFTIGKGVERGVPRFVGQIGVIHVIEEALTKDTVRLIAQLGPNYMSSFLPVDQPNFSERFSSLFAQNLWSKVVFTFNPRAKTVVDGTMICENVAMTKTYRLNDAILSEGTRLCRSHSVPDIINAVGGVPVLFPFFLRNDAMLLDANSDVETELDRLLWIVFALMESHPHNQEAIRRSRAFRVLGFLLKQISPQHFSMMTVDVVDAIFRIFVDSQRPNEELFSQVLTYLLFDFSLWVYVRPEVQIALFHKLCEGLRMRALYATAVRSVVSVQSFLDDLRFYYWGQREKDISLAFEKTLHPRTSEVIAQHPSVDEIRPIRAELLNILRLLIGTGRGIDAQELSLLVTFLSSCSDVSQVRDLAQVLLEKMIASPQIHLSNGFEVFMNMLSFDDEDVRILGIRCLAQFLLTHPRLAANHRIEKDLQFGMLKVYNLLYRHHFTERMYRAMRDALFGHISIGDAPLRAELDESTLLTPFLHAIFKLLIRADVESRRVILRDWREVLRTYPRIKALMLSQYCWQDSLLSVLVPPANVDPHSPLFSDIRSVTIDIFASVLFYALMRLDDGFHQLEKSIAYVYYAEHHGRPVSPLEFIPPLYDRILKAYINCVVGGEIDPRIVRSDRNVILDNLLYFLQYVEDYVFYYRSTHKVLARNATAFLARYSQASPKKSTFSIKFSLRGRKRPGSLHVEKLGHGTPSSLLLPRNEEEFLSPNRQRSRIRMDSITTRWLDLDLAKSVLTIIRELNLSPVTNYSTLGPFVKTTTNLRKGGVFRMMVRYLVAVFRHATDDECVGELIERDVDVLNRVLHHDFESKREISKLREVLIMTGEMQRENVKLQSIKNRVVLILAVMFNMADRLIADSNPLYMKMIEKIKEVFEMSGDTLTQLFLNERKEAILPMDSLLFRQGTGSVGGAHDDYVALTSTTFWADMERLYFGVSFEQTRQKENSFFKDIIERRLFCLRHIEEERKEVSKKEESIEEEQTVGMVRSLEELGSTERERIRKQRIKKSYATQISSRLWQSLIKGICNARGIWGNEDEMKRWRLDFTENRYRMRLKLKRDFSEIDHSNASAAARRLMTREDEDRIERELEEARKKENPFLRVKTGSISMHRYDHVDDEDGVGDDVDYAIVMRAEEEEGEGEVEGAPEEELVDDEDEALALLGKKEHTLRDSVYCEIITPMQAYSGRLEITTKRLLWFVDRENECYSFEKNDRVSKLEKVPKDLVWFISDIREIHPRRYQLDHTAVEIFFVNRRNILLNFRRGVRDKIVKTLVRTKPPLLTFVPRSSPAENLKRSGLTAMWVRGEISNFEYLMKLNTFANRTYNDLSQYPVFPWVLSDYSSETLDLDDPSVYRDLSLPIGVLDMSVREDILSKYHTLKQTLPEGERPWMYGSHYSSSAIVNYYLIRMEPFTTYFRILQGGFFDHADRMFDSIPLTWKNCLMSGRDFKELIPEFFYLPEFLVMMNELDLGTKQSGQRLGDVKLPPWAESPEDFIRKNRAALESEFVSKNLHHWIDLIFGYKQTGPQAEEAANVFRPYTYEHLVDIDKIQEPRKKISVISEIMNFGQCPSKMFRRPHLERMDSVAAGRLQMYDPCQTDSTFFLKDISRVVDERSIVTLRALQDKIVAVSSRGTVVAIRFSAVAPQATTEVLLRRQIAVSFHRDLSYHQRFFISALRPHFVFSCSHWDDAVKCTTTRRANPEDSLVQTIPRHKDSVTCLTLVGEETRNEVMLVTGSTDTTVIVWDVDFEAKLPVRVSPRNVLFGHDDEVTCVAANSELDVVVSAGKDATLIVHTLRGGRFLRSLRHPTKGVDHPDKAIFDLVAVSDDGHVVGYSHYQLSIVLFSINGKVLARVDTSDPVSSLLTRECKYLFYSEVSGVLVCRVLHNLDLVFKYDIKRIHGLNLRIVSLHVKDDFLFAGTADGRVLCLRFR